MTPTSPVERRRVTWPAGDPKRAREAWGKDACAYARRKNRPTVVALVAALVPALHSEYGYAWISDEKLRSDMGSKHRSAVSRAIKIADEDLGLIERETVSKMGDGGLFLGNERRIYPARPADMGAVLMDVRASKPAPKFGDRRRAAEEAKVRGSTPRPMFHRSPNSVSRKSEPKSERLGQDTGLLVLSREEKYTEAHSDFGDAARSVVGRSRLLVDTVERASLLDPSEPTAVVVGTLLDLGRPLYVARREHRMSARDEADAVEALRDAAKRSWVDHDARVVKMFEAFDRAGGDASQQRRAVS